MYQNEIRINLTMEAKDLYTGNYKRIQRGKASQDWS
jgi:hypothetical protein